MRRINGYIKFVIPVVMALAFSINGRAQFFGFSIVSDPTTHIEQIKQLTSMIQQYNQMRQEYQMWQQQLQSLRFMGSRYYWQSILWRVLAQSQNNYGHSGMWQNAAMTGQGAQQAYRYATVPLSLMQDFSRLPQDAQLRLADHYATVNLRDAANTTALGEIGDSRQAIQQIQARIASLQGDSLSASPSLSNEIAVMQKSNAAAVMGVQLSADREKIMLSILENQVLQSKAQRDAAAGSLLINNYCGSIQSDQTAASFRGMGQALNNYTIQ